jgi:hypothetical protein
MFNYFIKMLQRLCLFLTTYAILEICNQLLNSLNTGKVIINQMDRINIFF